jgi:hypothetical protein
MAMRQDLHEDLKAVHQKIVEAKQAVANAISQAVSIVKGGQTDNGQ